MTDIIEIYGKNRSRNNICRAFSLIEHQIKKTFNRIIQRLWTHDSFTKHTINTNKLRKLTVSATDQAMVRDRGNDQNHERNNKKTRNHGIPRGKYWKKHGSHSYHWQPV